MDSAYNLIPNSFWKKARKISFPQNDIFKIIDNKQAVKEKIKREKNYINLSDEKSRSKIHSSSEIVESNILILPISTENEGRQNWDCECFERVLRRFWNHADKR